MCDSLTSLSDKTLKFSNDCIERKRHEKLPSTQPAAFMTVNSKIEIDVIRLPCFACMQNAQRFIVFVHSV